MSIPNKVSMFKFIINILLYFFFVCGIQAQVDTIKTKVVEKSTKEKLLKGIFVQVDAASILSSAFVKNSTYSMEGGVQFDLKRKYFPVIEIGYAGADKLSNNDVMYFSNVLFERIGIDFNLSKPKKDALPTNNLILGGVRLGMSNFDYNISNIKITDNYWGGTESPDYSMNTTSKLWFEIVFSVKVEVFKNAYMGWTVRNKNLLGTEIPNEVFPWFIPGYGINKSTSWGFNYMIGYRF